MVGAPVQWLTLSFRSSAFVAAGCLSVYSLHLLPVPACQKIWVGGFYELAEGVTVQGCLSIYIRPVYLACQPRAAGKTPGLMFGVILLTFIKSTFFFLSFEIRLSYFHTQVFLLLSLKTLPSNSKYFCKYALLHLKTTFQCRNALVSSLCHFPYTLAYSEHLCSQLSAIWISYF